MLCYRTQCCSCMSVYGSPTISNSLIEEKTTGFLKKNEYINEKITVLLKLLLPIQPRVIIFKHKEKRKKNNKSIKHCSAKKLEPIEPSATNSVEVHTILVITKHTAFTII